MTNYEKIISELTIDNLADKMEKYTPCETCPIKPFCKASSTDTNCNDIFKAWLQQEVED